jgi:hypothetical protein
MAGRRAREALGARSRALDREPVEAQAFRQRVVRSKFVVDDVD